MRANFKPRHFEGFTVSGHAHPQADGSVQWHVCVYRGSNHTRPHHDVWVVAGALHRTSPTLHPANGPQFALGDPIPDHDPAEQAAILKAVAQWQTERATVAG